MLPSLLLKQSICYANSNTSHLILLPIEFFVTRKRFTYHVQATGRIRMKGMTYFLQDWLRMGFGMGLCWLLAGSAMAQEEWTAYTAMRQVEALSASEDAIWAATAGGVFSYQTATGELQRYTAAEGLHNVQTDAIVYDAARDGVWVGYRDGVLDFIDVETGSVETFFDIERNERFPSRGIQRLVISGDSLLAATAFGLVIWDPIKNEVRDTYSKLGTLASKTPVRDVVLAPLPDGQPGIWVATDGGVAYAPLNTPNLQVPDVWTVESASLSSQQALSIGVFQGRIYVGTERGLSELSPDGSFSDVGGSGGPVRDLVVSGGELFFVDQFKVVGLDAGGSPRSVLAGFENLSSIISGPGGNLWVGDRLAALTAIAVPAGGSGEVVIAELAPKGPTEGTFADLAVDTAGNLWSGAAEGTLNGGFYRLSKEGDWTSFTRRTVGELENRGGYTTVHTDAKGNFWAGSQGNGVAQVTPEGEILIYDDTNSSLLSAPGTTDFIVVTGISSEPDGTLWVANREATSPLHVRTPDGTWTALPPPQCDGLLSVTVLGEVFVDSFNQKWIAVIDPSNFRLTRGIMVLDTGADPTDPDDDQCRFINQTSAGGVGLPSTQITSIEGDRDGWVWVGTTQGIAYFISSRVAAQDPTTLPNLPQRAEFRPGENPFLLENVQVNDVAADPANRLWIATNIGAFLIQRAENGFEQVLHFSAAETPLFSNIVSAITVHPETGEVFFATEQGLIGFQGDAIAPSASIADLFVYPNPLRVVDGEAPVVFIEGLVEQTDVRIIAPHGEVVARFPARGGRVRWDGRDRNQQLVPSGVYLVVAVSENGDGTAYGKVAVIR